MMERALLRDFEQRVAADRVPSRFDTSRDLPVVRARRALFHETANRLPPLAVEFAAAEGGGATVAEIADCFVTSFERTIAVVAADVNDGRWARFFLGAVDARLKVVSQLAPVLRNVAHPEVTLVHRAMLYRCLAATWLDEWVARPLGLSGLSYALHLYTETHMAWLGAAVRHNVVEDGDWLRPAARARLASYYPLPNRVVCFEELPDMAALLMRWNVMGTPQQNKKKRRCIQRDLAHLFLAKQLPQICHVRHIVALLRKKAASTPEVATLFRMLIRIGLCGNYESVTWRAPLALRLRIHLAFAEDVIGGPGSVPVTTAAELFDWGEANKQHKQAVLFLLQEHFINVCEAEGVLDTMLSESRIKWCDFKRTVRHTTRRLRQELARQAERNEDFFAPLRWEGGDSAFTSIMQAGHTLMLATTWKNVKGRPGFVIAKKMVRSLPRYYSCTT
jgi:hypothetical protein